MPITIVELQNNYQTVDYRIPEDRLFLCLRHFTSIRPMMFVKPNKCGHYQSILQARSVISQTLDRWLEISRWITLIEKGNFWSFLIYFKFTLVNTKPYRTKKEFDNERTLTRCLFPWHRTVGRKRDAPDDAGHWHALVAAIPSLGRLAVGLQS